MEITIKEFKEQYLPMLQEQFHTKIQKNIESNGEVILKKLYKELEGVISFSVSFQKEIPIEIGEIQISLLQTSVVLGKPQIAFCVYNASGILGEEIYNLKFDAQWMFEPWQEYYDLLENKVLELHAENYIRKAALQQMMLESMDFIIYCLYAITKYHFIEFFRMNKYEELILADNFRLSVGGYRDWSRTLYRKCPPSDIFFGSEQKNFKYAIFNEAVYNQKKFENLELGKTYFYDCEFVHSYFSNTVLRDAIFENCRFYHCEFEKTDFCGATFRNVTMKKCTFTETIWNYVPDMERLEDFYKNVDLKSCVLEYISFNQSDLRGIRINDCQWKEIEIVECEKDDGVFEESRA